jgi:hypothetical protein
VKHLFAELSNILSGKHARKLEGVSFDEFDDFIQNSEDLSILVLAELEFLVLPNILDLTNVASNLGFLLSYID